MSDQPTNPASTQESQDAPVDACEHLRSTIRKLQTELAERSTQSRPMPSSVMRAYQKLIDRNLKALDTETAKQIDPDKS